MKESPSYTRACDQSSQHAQAGVVFVRSLLLHGTDDISAFAFTVATVFPVGNDEI